jgi:genome maintenance exonuclease 1
VTTILSGTKDKAHLDAWAARVGQDEAEKIRNDAANVGTHMHSVVERLLLNRPLETPRTWLAVKGYWMGYKLIETFMPHVNEVWGTEIPLYYPEKYAGTSDCIGVYKDHSAIIDFKQTNKMKQRGWIEDYFIQLAAYAAAHNVVHGTNIRQGIILMVAQDGETKEFLTCGREFDGYINQWMRRVDQYVAQKEAPGVPGLKDSTSEGENE